MIRAQAARRQSFSSHEISLCRRVTDPVKNSGWASPRENSRQRMEEEFATPWHQEEEICPKSAGKAHSEPSRVIPASRGGSSQSCLPTGGGQGIS